MAFIEINLPDGCCPEPDSIRILLEKLMASMQELTDKVNELGLKVGEQTALISQVRTYVSSIEAQVRDLASGEVLSTTMQERVANLTSAVDQAVQAIGASQGELQAAADGDHTT